MLDKVLQTILRYNMLPRGSRVIAAVSGGPDSVCLLHVLVELAAKAAAHVEVAHLNHLLRGTESDADEQFVRDLAARLNLRFHLARTDVAALTQENGGNLEQTARRARQAFFRSLNGGGRSGFIATGHTRDDQAETVLLRLLRGSGLAGLAGILPVTTAGTVRPLLDVTRAEIMQYLRNRALGWREDSSNRDPRFARNRARHELLPYLTARWNPHLVRSLAQLADLSHEEERWWQGPASPLQTVPLLSVDSRGGGIEFATEVLGGLPRAVARRAIRRAIAETKGDLLGVEFEHVEKILNLADRKTGNGRFQIPGLDVRRSFDRIRLSVPGAFTRVPSVALNIPGTYACPDGKSMVRIEIDPKGGTGGGLSHACATLGTAVLSLRRISGEIQLRGWMPGDRYRPNGDRRIRKVTELFAEARVPSWHRPYWPMVISGKDILWSRQFGAAADFTADDHAGPILRISEEKRVVAESFDRSITSL